MWLVKVELGDLGDQQCFECKVCDRKTTRMPSHLAQHQQPKWRWPATSTT
jgi:hypothetical protein